LRKPGRRTLGAAFVTRRDFPLPEKLVKQGLKIELETRQPDLLNRRK